MCRLAHPRGALEACMRIGILTGGGDCPGLNAVIRAVVRRAVDQNGDEVIGFRDGWRGVLDDDALTLDITATRGLLPRGGTVLGTSRTNPYAVDGGPERLLATLERRGVDALIPLGGGGTPGGAPPVVGARGPLVGGPETNGKQPAGAPHNLAF